jgi:anti-sigma regulatory factor (Ser/Thr protein kinase)
VVLRRGQFAANKFVGCDVADWVNEWSTACGFDDETNFAMRLCVEELATNIIMHGLGNDLAGHTIEVTLDAEHGRPRIVMLDDGIAFDTAAAIDLGREGTIESATFGGRGIRLVRALSERIEWQRVDGRNQTTLVFKTAKAQDK